MTVSDHEIVNLAKGLSRAGDLRSDGAETLSIV